MSRSQSKTFEFLARAGVAAAILLGGVTAVVAQPAPGGMQGGPGAMQQGGPGMQGGMMAHHEGMGGGMRGGMHAGGMQHMERMLRAAGATPEQRAKVHQIMKAAHEAGRALHQQMAQLLTAPKLDAAAVEAQRQKLSAQHDAVSKRMTQAMLDASAVLTPEQREKMVATMKARKDLMERHRREREALDPAHRN